MEAVIENASREAEDDLSSITDSNKQACGTEQSMTEDTEDKATQSNAEKKEKKKTSKPATRPVYIRIPFSVFSNEKNTQNANVDPNDTSLYKLIDRVPRSDTDIRKRKSYIMSFNSATNNADWVYEILNRSTLTDNCREQMSFGRNDFDNECNQGHLAAAANHRWCQEAYHDTFLISNMVPQKRTLNEGMWSTLEGYCRDKVNEDREDKVLNVHVYTGPLYLKIERQHYVPVPDPSKMKHLGIKVMPTHFFKVIIVENKDGTVEKPECYVMPNENPQYNELKAFKKDICDIETQSGLTFIECDIKFNMQLEKTVKLTGEDRNGVGCSVDLKVRISPPRI